MTIARPVVGRGGGDALFGEALGDVPEAFTARVHREDATHGGGLYRIGLEAVETLPGDGPLTGWDAAQRRPTCTRRVAGPRGSDLAARASMAERTRTWMRVRPPFEGPPKRFIIGQARCFGEAAKHATRRGDPARQALAIALVRSREQIGPRSWPGH